MWADFSTTQKVGMFAQFAGGISSAFAASSKANSDAANFEFQAQIADINARQSERSAQAELNKGQQQIASLTLKAGKLKSQQRASLAASGVDLGVGNAAEIQASTDIMKEVDKNNLELNALQSAWGHRMQGINSQSKAAMSRASASGISSTGAVVSSLMGSAKGVADSWYKYSKEK